MRYLSFVAVLLLLPVTASAQQSVVAGARRAVPKQSEARQSDQRQNEQRQNAQRQSERRSEEGRSERRAERRQSDQRDSRNEQRPTTGLSPLGLRPQAPSPVPSWERPQTPWWERQNTPSWEQPKAPAWETGNPARTRLNEERDRKWREEARRGKDHRPSRRGGSTVIVVPPYRFFPYPIVGGATYVAETPAPQQIVEPYAPPPAPEPAGILRLEVEPKELLQIFVDGVYLGTPADLGEELALEPGTHRIELRAPGYRTATFDAEIIDARSITYRASLERLESATPPVVTIKPPAIEGSKTMYVIPGCYLGNVEPTQANLRPGCDMSKLSKVRQ